MCVHTSSTWSDVSTSGTGEGANSGQDSAVRIWKERRVTESGNGVYCKHRQRSDPLRPPRASRTLKTRSCLSGESRVERFDLAFLFVSVNQFHPLGIPMRSPFFLKKLDYLRFPSSDHQVG